MALDSPADGECSLALIVNGEARRVRAGTLAQLIDHLEFGTVRVATAVNGDFVAERARASHVLKEGDRVEIVAPRQGG
jgi:sulfur carrier protein